MTLILWRFIPVSDLIKGAELFCGRKPRAGLQIGCQLRLTTSPVPGESTGSHFHDSAAVIGAKEVYRCWVGFSRSQFSERKTVEVPRPWGSGRRLPCRQRKSWWSGLI